MIFVLKAVLYFFTILSQKLSDLMLIKGCLTTVLNNKRANCCTVIFSHEIYAKTINQKNYRDQLTLACVAGGSKLLYHNVMLYLPKAQLSKQPLS